MTTLITASIPYVNAAPHIGYAYELVQADIAARARRQLGDELLLATGTDDNSLKNVRAARQAGTDVADFVDLHADRFLALHDTLDTQFDSTVRTSSDPRHALAVDRIWRAAAESGDLYRKRWGGSYCVGCELFLREAELDTDGFCPDHGTRPEWVEEENWFFRLSAYADHLHDLIATNRLRISPEPFRREALAFIEAGLDDISVSRSAERAEGWGISVPDDESQVVYVWFDALTNYLSALGWCGSASPWRDLDERIHVVGKGILRFHAIYWPAFLAAAGEPPPTEIRVHPYLTAEGTKISKSTGGGLDPIEVAHLVSADGLRWFFARDVNDVADTDVSTGRIVARVNDELANGLGNAVNRLATLAQRLPSGIPEGSGRNEVTAACAAALADLAEFEHRSGAAAIARSIGELNAGINAAEPWTLGGAELAHSIGGFVAETQAIARAIRPVCPQFAARILAQLSGPTIPPPTPTFQRITTN